MTLEREMPRAIVDEAKAQHTRFLPILRRMVLIVALCAFIPFLRVFLYEGKQRTEDPVFLVASLVFLVASFALIVITPKRETRPAIDAERTVRACWQPLPWSIIAYLVVTGAGYTWVCAFLWFSRRYAFFSGPVIGAMGLILVSCTAIGFGVAWLTRGNWQTALLTFGIALYVPSIIVLRLRLLR